MKLNDRPIRLPCAQLVLRHGQRCRDALWRVRKDLAQPAILSQRFLDFLAEHASADAAGFDHLLKVVPEGVTRTELAARFKDWKPEWSETVANTNAAAFVARAREWGLLEEKLINGRYALTEFGEWQRGKVRS